MRKLMIIIFSTLLFLTACTSPLSDDGEVVTERVYPEFEEIEIPRTFLPKPITVVGLGDSLTEGIGDELKNGGYFGRLSILMEDWTGISDVEATNLAKKGRRSDQLIEQLEKTAVQEHIQQADMILITIGGNDLMKIIKRDLFKLRVKPFYEEMEKFADRLSEVFSIIRALNDEAVIVIGGLYNPFSIVGEEPLELKEILADWNTIIANQTYLDGKACFVDVYDLFYSNDNMVYHTDFFHPNAKGYAEMTERYIESLKECNLKELSNGNFDL